MLLCNHKSIDDAQNCSGSSGDNSPNMFDLSSLPPSFTIIFLVSSFHLLFVTLILLFWVHLFPQWFPVAPLCRLCLFLLNNRIVNDVDMIEKAGLAA
jgi:hypothetical protein